MLSLSNQCEIHVNIEVYLTCSKACNVIMIRLQAALLTLHGKGMQKLNTLPSMPICNVSTFPVVLHVIPESYSGIVSEFSKLYTLII